MSELISIIISSFNAQKYIKETIDSILRQTYLNIELIVIDDGSTDLTLNILKDYQYHPNFKLVKRIHTGNIGKNLNEGIRLSSGKYICVCGADDVWKSEKLTVQMKFAPEYNCIATNALIINSNGDISHDKYNNDLLTNKVVTLNELLFNNCIIASSVMVKKSILKECGLFDEEFGNRAEDYYLWLNITEKYPILILADCLLKYRFHAENLSNKSLDDIEELSLRSIEIRKKYLKMNDEIVLAAREGILFEYSRLLNVCIARKKWNKASFMSNEARKYILDKLSIKYIKYLIFPLLIRIFILFNKRD